MPDYPTIPEIIPNAPIDENSPALSSLSIDGTVYNTVNAEYISTAFDGVSLTPEETLKAEASICFIQRGQDLFVKNYKDTTNNLIYFYSVPKAVKGTPDKIYIKLLILETAGANIGTYVITDFEYSTATGVITSIAASLDDIISASEPELQAVTSAVLEKALKDSVIINSAIASGDHIPNTSDLYKAMRAGLNVRVDGEDYKFNTTYNSGHTIEYIRIASVEDNNFGHMHYLSVGFMYLG